MLNRSLLVKETIHVSHIYRSFYFFNLNFCFLANSKLMTSPVTLLSNNTSTVTLTYVSILSSLIFTITFLNIFPLSRLQQELFSITLESIANLLLLKPHQGLLDSLSYLNY